MAGVREENRLHIALLLLGLGTILILVGVFLAIQRYYGLHELQETRLVTGTPASKVPVERGAQAKLIRQVLFTLVVLVGIFTISMYAFRVWSRRFRRLLLHKPAPPTPDADVWAMHRLPEDALDETPEAPPDAEPEKGP
jgi:hypothetical protein